MKSKLVRDNIPELILKTGRKPIVREIEESDIPLVLISKFLEEIQELVSNPCAEEAADVYEVLSSFCYHHGIEMKQVHEAANAKRLERGGFFKGVILEAVEEKLV